MDYRTADNLKFHRQIAVSFKNGNSFAHENGYDSEMYDMGGTDMSWKFTGNPLNYVIAGVQPINTELEVPLEIVTDALKDLTIEIDEIESIDYDIYLKDKNTNTLYNLTSAPANIQLAAGTYTDRFVIAFQAKALSTEDIVLEEHTQVYFDGISKELVINNTNNSQLQKVTLYNVLGQKVANWDLQNNQGDQRLKVNKLPTSIYIFKLQSDKGTFSKKIVIH